MVTVFFQLAHNGFRINALTAVVVRQGSLHGLLGQNGAVHLDGGQTFQSFYNGLLEILTDNDTYAWHDIFPNAKFDKDANGASSCYGECAQKWPPLIATSGAKADGKFTQDDYKALVAKMFDGTIKVDNGIGAMPAVTNVKVNDQGNLK